MCTAIMVINNCTNITGEAGDLAFTSNQEQMRATIKDLDYTKLLDVIRETGYLRDYVEENKEYFKDCLEGAR